MRVSIVLLFSLMEISISIYNTYCSSHCLDYYGTCVTQSHSDAGCIVCGRSIYNQNPDPVTNKCILNNQTEILTVDLQSPISLAGFTGSSLVPFACGSWTLSGKYVQGSSLSKVYQTPTPHYIIVVRYNLLYMGSTWSASDTMTVAIDDNIISFGFKCPIPTTLCSTQDCPKIGDIIASHNASNATVVFTSNILNSSGASWGISNLIIALRTCNLKCNTCFGPSPNQCLSCSNNSYLLGNTCVRQCPAMSVPSINLCVPSCPGGFYSVMSTKTCSSCSKGCTVCTGPLQSNCILDQIQPSLWQQQKQFWIFIIILSCIIILIGLVFLVIKRRKDKAASALKTPIINNQKNIITEVDLSILPSYQKTGGYMNDQINNNSQSSSSNSNDSDQGPKAVKVKRKWKGKQ